MEFDNELNAEIIDDLARLQLNWKRARVYDKFKLTGELDSIKKKMLLYISKPIKKEMFK